MDKEKEMTPKINRHNRRKMQRHKKKVSTTKLVKEDPQTHYTDDSYKDKTKRVFKSGMQYVKDRLEAAKAKFDLPEKVDTVRRNYRSKVVIINRDGREREFLPDIPPQHKILVHRSVAKVMVSKVCMLVRITASRNKEDKYIDGSWAITPAEYQMMNGTTIQHVRRRSWFFLRRSSSTMTSLCSQSASLSGLPANTCLSTRPTSSMTISASGAPNLQKNNNHGSII